MSQTQTQANESNERLFGTLSYVVPFFLLVPLIQKQSAFASYHAMQALTLWVAAIVAGVALGFGLALVPLAILATLISGAYSLAVLGMMVLGALNAWNGKTEPLPVIGQYASRFNF